ncbi:outer spore coat protein CotE [Sporosarcina sp. HYO08]|uniref:outer spore coat protein CotE n=1 Tax=Sporosarcina sp. HYO08 TaxID=1759557 RepID=UPI0009EB0640|nr:outer spore coat protein CotE [Sporosarcina sp. HYO08]
MVLKNLRQIVAKTIIAKGKKRTEDEVKLKPPNSPTSILGCWVINHTHQAKKNGKYVEVSGKFDVNVWYSHHDHCKTSVFTESVPYRDRIRLHYRDEPTSAHEEVIVSVIQHPNCTEAVISDCGEKFCIKVERELLAEVVGETKICVTVHPHSNFEEEWSYNDESSSHHHGHGQSHGHHREHEVKGAGHGHEHKKGKDT